VGHPPATEAGAAACHSATALVGKKFKGMSRRGGGWRLPPLRRPMDSCSVATHLSLAGRPAHQRRLRQPAPGPSQPPTFKGLTCWSLRCHPPRRWRPLLATDAERKQFEEKKNPKGKKTIPSGRRCTPLLQHLTYMLPCPGHSPLQVRRKVLATLSIHMLRQVVPQRHKLIIIRECRPGLQKEQERAGRRIRPNAYIGHRAPG